MRNDQGASRDARSRASSALDSLEAARSGWERAPERAAAGGEAMPVGGSPARLSVFRERERERDLSVFPPYGLGGDSDREVSDS